MTTASVTTVPTHGRQPLYGTNPIAVAAPAGREHPFLLDMATSVVARGKLEVHERLEKPLPVGWAVKESGEPVIDSAQVLAGSGKDAGWGLLPLGGVGEMLGGHKGYGLAMVVEILCALLSGAAYADLVYPRTPEGKPLPANIGHFFGAWHVDSFRPVDQFKADMDDLQRRLKNAPKAEGQSRIYVPGEKEYEEAARRTSQGIPLEGKVVRDLARLAQELGLNLEL
jgi:LDH2 family malate/lactate/ureidoglycolate dehydrogenase